MSSIGTFGSFTQARLGIYTAQQGLGVVGNNISNINTPGYTRQSLDQISLYARGSDRYYQKYDVRIGNGSLAVGVSQIRDPYLDIRYRSQSASVGSLNTTLEGLNSIAQILDDVGAGQDENGIIGAQFSDLLKTLQNLSDQTGQEVYDSQVRTSAAALISLFNSTATSLQEVYNNTLSHFKEDLTTVNEILNNIRDLNATIRKSDLHGDSALELRDERNRLIDELAEYVKINVSYTEEDIGAGMKVEKLTIRLAGANPDNSVDTDDSLLVDGRYAAQFTMPEKMPKINPKYDPYATPPVNGKYLDDQGNPTDDKTAAAQVDNDLFLMGLTKLYDDRGREWENLVKSPVKTYTSKQDAIDAMIQGATEEPPAGSGIYTFDDGQGSRYRYTITEQTDANGTVTGYALSTLRTDYSQEVELDDNDLYGSFQANRELLTESGEFASTGCINGIDEKAASKRGIPYYQKVLDLLANRFAAAFNEANTGYMTDEEGYYIDDTGKRIVLGDDGQTPPNPMPINKYMDLTPNQKTALGAQPLEEYLAANGAYQPEGAGNLFSSSGDGNNGEGITASNISISLGWLQGDFHVVPSYVKPSMLDETASMDNENIVHFRALMEAQLKYIPSDVAEDGSDIPMFTGSFMEMVNHINSTLGNAQRSTQIELTTAYASAVEINTNRDAVSGVDLNDEAVNMIQYQKAYTAACRLMTAIDEALERLISNTGVVGR